MLKSNITKFQQTTHCGEHTVIHQQFEDMRDTQQYQQVNEKISMLEGKQIFDKQRQLAISSKNAQKVIVTELSEKEDERDKQEEDIVDESEPALLRSLKRVVLSTGGGRRQEFSSQQIEAYKQELVQCLRQQQQETEQINHNLGDCDISAIAKSSEYDFKSSIKMFENTKDFEEEKQNYLFQKQNNNRRSIGQQKIINNQMSEWNTYQQDKQAVDNKIQQNSGQLKSREFLEGFGQQQPLKGDLSISCLANTVEYTDRTIDYKFKDPMANLRLDFYQRYSDQITKQDDTQNQINQIMQPLKQLFQGQKEQINQRLNHQESPISQCIRNNRFKQQDSQVLPSSKQSAKEEVPTEGFKVIQILNEECVPNPIQKIRRISGSSSRNEIKNQRQFDGVEQLQLGVSRQTTEENIGCLNFNVNKQKLVMKHCDESCVPLGANQSIPQVCNQQILTDPRLFPYSPKKYLPNSSILSSPQPTSNTDILFSNNLMAQHTTDKLHQTATYISSKPPIETPTYTMPMYDNSNLPNKDMLLLLPPSSFPASGISLSRRNSLKENLQHNTSVKLRISHESGLPSQQSSRIAQEDSNEQLLYLERQKFQKLQETAIKQGSLQNSVQTSKLTDGSNVQMKIIKGIRKSREPSLSQEETSNIKPQHINPTAKESINQMKCVRERLNAENPLLQEKQATPMKQESEKEENDINELELPWSELAQVEKQIEGVSSRLSDKQGKVEIGYKRFDLKLNDSIDFSKENISKIKGKGDRDCNSNVMPDSTDSQDKLLAIIQKTNQNKIISKVDSAKQFEKKNLNSSLCREAEANRTTDPFKQTYLLGSIDNKRNRTSNIKPTLHFQYDGGLESKTSQNNNNNIYNYQELDINEFFTLSGAIQKDLKELDEHNQVTQYLESSQLEKLNIQAAQSIDSKHQIEESIQQQLPQEIEQQQKKQIQLEINQQQLQFILKEQHQQQLQLTSLQSSSSTTITTPQPQNNQQQNEIQTILQKPIDYINQNTISSTENLQSNPIVNRSRYSNNENDQINNTTRTINNISAEQKTIARSLQVLQAQQINVQIDFDIPIANSDKTNKLIVLSNEKNRNSEMTQIKSQNDKIASNSMKKENRYANENCNPLDVPPKRSSTKSKYNYLQNSHLQSQYLTTRRNSSNDGFGVTSHKCSVDRKATNNVSVRPSVSQINYIEVFQKRLAGSSSSQQTNNSLNLKKYDQKDIHSSQNSNNLQRYSKTEQKSGQLHSQNKTSFLVESQKQQQVPDKTKEIAADSRNRSTNSQHVSSSLQQKIKSKMENRTEYQENNDLSSQQSQIVQSSGDQNRVYRPLLDNIKKGTCNAPLQEQLQNRIWSSSNRSMNLE